MKSLLDVRRRAAFALNNRKAHPCIGFALALCLLLPLAGFAQEAPPESETEQAEAEAEATAEETGEVESAEEAEEEAAAEESVAAADEPAPDVEEIVVTGSRIRRDAFTAALPVTVITSEGAALAGLTSTADILQSSALASGTQIDNSFGGFVVSGGPGVNTFGLRSLNAGRTLLLVNGRRFTPAGTRGAVSSVDLNTIPFVAVQRIEILKDGASSVYGADAVAGVVNIITRKRFDDFAIRGNFTDELDYREMSMIYGKTWDRGFFDFSLEYNEFGPVRRAENTWSYCDQEPLTDGGIYSPVFTPNGNCLGRVFNFARIHRIGSFRPNPANATGWLGIGRNAPAPVGHFDTRNPEEEEMIGNSKLLQIYSDGEWDFDLDRVAWLGALGDWLGAVTTEYEFYYTSRSFRRHGGHNQFFPDVSPSNPTQPFNEPTQLTNNPNLLFDIDSLSDFIERDIEFIRPIVMTYDLLDPHDAVENDVTTIRVGAEGDLGLYQWQLDASHSWSRGEYSYDTLLKDKVARALAVVSTSQGIRCPNTQAELDSVEDQLEVALEEDADTFGPRILAEGPDPNCVPLDLFSREALTEGFIPQDAADYVTEWVTGKTAYNLSTVNFQVEGELFTLPAGAARGVVGLEWRRRELDDRPPQVSADNNQWGLTSAGRTVGRDRVSEAYTEVELPLLAGYALSGVSVAEELTLNLSWRYTDYSSYGNEDTWRVLLNYAPNPVFRVRTSLGTSFRAPSLYQLHLNRQTGFISAERDPCNNYRDDQRSTQSNTYINCDAQLATILEADGADNFFPSSSILGVTGGNRDLKAETSDSLSLGLIVTPDLAGLLPQLGVNLSLAWDYYEIDIENAIAQFPSFITLPRCYASENFSAPECALIGEVGEDGERRMRDPLTGDLTFLNTSFFNIAVEETRGYDITLRMDREFALGDLSVDILASRLLSYKEVLVEGSEPTEFNGLHTYPDWRGEAEIRFDLRDWSFTWTMDYIGDTEEEPTETVTDEEELADRGVTNVRHADSRLYHTFSIRYSDPKERFDFVAGIRNLMDKDPPLVGWPGAAASKGTFIGYNIPLGGGYDLFGRRFFATLTYSFY